MLEDLEQKKKRIADRLLEPVFLRTSPKITIPYNPLLFRSKSEKSERIREGREAVKGITHLID
ncbi:MAG: hypothetical protein ACFFCW_43735 [Candidatus Hodarchaeota archaeon]